MWGRCCHVPQHRLNQRVTEYENHGRRDRSPLPRRRSPERSSARRSSRSPRRDAHSARRNSRSPRRDDRRRSRSPLYRDDRRRDDRDDRRDTRRAPIRSTKLCLMSGCNCYPKLGYDYCVTHRHLQRSLYTMNERRPG